MTTEKDEQTAEWKQGLTEPYQKKWSEEIQKTAIAVERCKKKLETTPEEERHLVKHHLEFAQQYHDMLLRDVLWYAKECTKRAEAHAVSIERWENKKDEQN